MRIPRVSLPVTSWLIHVGFLAPPGRRNVHRVLHCIACLSPFRVVVPRPLPETALSRHPSLPPQDGLPPSLNALPACRGTLVALLRCESHSPPSLSPRWANPCLSSSGSPKPSLSLLRLPLPLPCLGPFPDSGLPRPPESNTSSMPPSVPIVTLLLALKARLQRAPPPLRCPLDLRHASA